MTRTTDPTNAELEAASLAWSTRACSEARFNPKSQVGSVMWQGEFPAFCCCADQGVSIQFTAVNVPSDGDCLYHSVWQSACGSSLPRPFGLRGVDHVYTLRVMVACQAVAMLKAGQICRADIDDILEAGDLVAKPKQWVRFSGVVPTMAMSYLLRRTIVTVSADLVYSVCPYDFEALHGIPDNEDPIVIYHCCSANPHVAVSRESRNHYTAVRLDAANIDRVKRYVATYRTGVSVQGEASLAYSVEPASGKRKRNTEAPRNADGCEEAPDRRKAPRATRTKYSSVCKDTQEKKPASSRAQALTNEVLLKSLERRALTLKKLTSEELRVLAESQNFTRSPRLALLYYHCCSNDPDAFVHNDESLLGPSSSKTVERLNRVLPKPATQEEIASSQERANTRGSAKTVLGACASCCEVIKAEKLAPVAFKSLPYSFRYTEEESRGLARFPDWIIRDHVQVLQVQGVYYHLNPELVPNPAFVQLCASCEKDPRKTRFSIANGYDYGRSSTLPELNDVASKCIAPARCFGLELSLNGKHYSGHAICFPSDGPVACSRILPCTDVECLPRVTFIGPKEQWRVRKKKYRKLYAIACEDVYMWLRVLQYTHSAFTEHQIVVDGSSERKAELAEMEAYIERNVAFQDENTSRAYQERMESERYGTDISDDNDDEIVFTQGATLKPPEGQQTTTHSVVETMLNMLKGESTVIPVQRQEDPIVEWNCNGAMIAGVFPNLFMFGGASLPPGSWSPEYIKHLMNYYDGRFEQSTALVALLFNQLQRHSAVKRAAKVGITHDTVLKRLGSLVNTDQFIQELERAKINPKASSSRRLNASLLRVLSLVGGTVPFSPFERAATRPKIAAMRYRYGVPQHWVTLAVPEHDDLLLHRIALLRKDRAWNDSNHRCSRAECSFEDLPDDLQQSAKARLAVSSKYPALAAMSFYNRFRVVIEDVMRSTIASQTKISRDYSLRCNSPYGQVAGHCSVIEAQVDGRLHSHSLIYGSTYTPQLLTRIACNPELRCAAAKWLESVSRLWLSPETHEWVQSFYKKRERQPRAFEVQLPSVQKGTTAFLKSCEMRVAATNFHSHSFTCHKGRRGKYMCRLARPAGVHEGSTNALIITRVRGGDLTKGVRPEMAADVIDEESSKVIDEGYDLDEGNVFPRRLRGPLVWELHRPENDANVVETNLVLAGLTQSHTNSSIVNGEDSGDSVEQYQQSYMTKDQAALNASIPMLLSAAKYIAVHPSKAEDRDTDIRKGKFLATRAVNKLTGGQEWSHSLMVHALIVGGSFLCNDIFWYVFPWALVKWWLRSVADVDCGSKPDVSDEVTLDHGSIETQLDELVAAANNDVGQSDSQAVSGSRGGTRSYKVGEQLLFVSQAESYVHRGPYFEAYSPLEFECIVDVLLAKEPKSGSESNAGRPARPGFAFAPTHPLFGQYEGYIRAKMPTAVFGGRLPPIWKDDTEDNSSNSCTRRDFARYVICTFTRWKGSSPEFECTEEGLRDLFRKWDHSEAPLINRQRYRYIRNLLQRGHRSSLFEMILTDWRNRGVDLWKDLQPAKMQSKHCSSDPELDGVLPDHCDVYALVEKITSSQNVSRRTTFRSMQDLILSVIDSSEHGNTSAQEFGEPASHGILQTQFEGGLRAIATRLHLTPETTASRTTSSLDGMNFNRGDADSNERTINTSGLSAEQERVLRHVLATIDDHEKPVQTCTMVHGAGGTGKSFVLRRICAEVEARGYKVVATCPTGAGACQLDRGQTFHSAFKCAGKASKKPSIQALELLKTVFDDRVALVIIDEASMFSVSMLQQLDERLRLLYGSSDNFGGKPILMVGDFSQLQVVKGTTLCKLMYTGDENNPAKNLFRLFKVMFLTRQERARDCHSQQDLLATMRSLPSVYPAADDWRRAGDQSFFPVTPDIVRTLTKQLTVEDVARDPKWVDESVVLVTNNYDRATMNAAMAKVLAKRQGVILFRWRKDVPREVVAELEGSENLLYNEEERPELFGYFYKGAAGQILDNANGNVSRGIANGTMCKYHSIAWDDESKTREVLEVVGSAIRRGDKIVDLPFPPEFINVSLQTREGGGLPASEWPQSDQVADSEGIVVVPIGIVASKTESYFVNVDSQRDLKLPYAQHAVDLASAMTIWKAQGATFERVLLLLEPSGRPAWNFEHLYVALSRVRAVDHIRCVPLSLTYKFRDLYKLRPNIFTVRWRMDLDEHGVWQDRKI